ncbi:MAG: BON domain-containing protein [Verrucomicrobiota bacterium]|nr:BON domain-containing protein [Verrucomicrobiota bacterium]
MNTLRILTAAAATTILLSVSGLTSCEKGPVERTPAEQQEDQKLAEQVKATFANSPSFKFPDVQVAAYKGSVQLSGFVVSDDQKTAAESLAKNVSGAKSVENKISLKH